MERIVNCNGSLHADGESIPPGPAAMRGTLAHEYIRDALTLGVEAALERVQPRSRKWLRSIDIKALKAYIGEDVFHCEQAFRYNVMDGGHDLLSCQDREYPEARPGDVFGTADLVIERSGYLEIADYKTGRTDRNNGPLLSDTWQLRTLAVMGSAAYLGVDVRTSLFYIMPDGSIEIGKAARLSALDLGYTADRIREAITGEPAYASGDHCRWCHARGKCPATRVQL